MYVVIIKMKSDEPKIPTAVVRKNYLCGNWAMFPSSSTPSVLFFELSAAYFPRNAKTIDKKKSVEI